MELETTPGLDRKGKSTEKISTRKVAKKKKRGPMVIKELKPAYRNWRTNFCCKRKKVLKKVEVLSAYKEKNRTQKGVKPKKMMGEDERRKGKGPTRSTRKKET